MLRPDTSSLVVFYHQFQEFFYQKLQSVIVHSNLFSISLEKCYFIKIMKPFDIEIWLLQLIVPTFDTKARKRKLVDKFRLFN